MTIPNSWLCSACGFDFYVPIGALRYTYVGLYDDARFPGRCLVAYRDHVEDFAEMSDASAHEFMDDVRRVGRILRRVVSADRVNYAVLGNAVTHVHAHVIPRWDTDPLPTKAPWSDPRLATPLPEGERLDLVRRLRAAVDAARNGGDS
jgi:diadenosine tetraphosphate (Ap4A) HIT family hydrolase